MTLSIGTVLGGRYEIIEKIGSGGMAIVYRGRDLTLERNVTIKVLKEEFAGDVDFKSRFKVEARAAAKLSHPNIVNVYDVGEEGDTQYIVMEYVHGDTLKQVVIKSAPLDNVTTISIAVQMASALSHAHKNGVVHRDVKPHNILVSVDGTIKITDFGIARAAAVSTVTTTTNALGSVYYFSPEQARGGYVDEKSDVYSLGITMFEMLTGKVPYEGDTSVAIALKHLNNELPDMKQYNPNVSDILQNIIKKATQKKKDDRYASIDLLMEDLRRALSEESQAYKKKIASVNGEKREVNNAAPSKDTSLDEATIAAATVGISMVAEKTVEAVEDQEIKVELAGGKKEYVLPEKAVDFEMYNKKFKISRGNDDEYEDDAPKKKPVPRKEQPRTSVRENQQKSPKTQIKSKSTKDADDDDDGYYRDKERKITIAAIITAVVIIAIISVVGTKFIKGEKLFGTTATVKTSEMPDFKNVPLTEAEKIAKSLGITITVKEEHYSSSIAEKNIISQSVEAGTSVSKGDAIEVVVSLGSKSFAMPDVVYDEESEALAKIEKQGGSVPELIYEYDETVPAAVVKAQTPTAQSQIDSGTKIILTISKGPETENAKVPNFVGMQLADAQKLAVEEGLTIGEVKENNETDGTKDKVISQSVATGLEVAKETKIDLVVIGSKIADTPEETPTDGETTAPEVTAAPNATTATKAGSKTFSIPAPTSYVDQENISVKMLKITNGSSVEVVFNEAKTIADFPFSVTLNGSGQEEVQLYIDNVYQWSQNVNFSEGGN